MQLKSKEELGWSDVVANNAMNRERKAIGINSYEKDVYLNPIKFIEERLDKGNVSWMDLCCGRGNALIEASKIFHEKKYKHKLCLEGLDLVDYFAEQDEQDEILSLKQSNLESWLPIESYDLITVVHGLHYIGDKLALIQKALAALKKDGLFTANLDLNNIKIKGKENSLEIVKSYFKKEKLNYNARKKVLRIEGIRKVQLPFRFIGANDAAGPNYTGQNVVDSYYEIA